MVDREIDRLRELPLAKARLDALAEDMSRQSQRMLDSVYAAHPQLPQHQRYSASDSLRMIADEMDEARLRATLDSINVSRLLRLTACRGEIVKKGAT